MIGISVVSIRAPTRGATVWQIWNYARLDVSIRAPARRATQPFGHALVPRCFYSRPRTEGDASHTAAERNNQCVSIRAPARRATGVPLKNNTASLFLFAPPHGGRLADLLAVVLDVVSIRAPARRATLMASRRTRSARFLFAPPHGGRLITRDLWDKVNGFYSRPRTEGDS